MPSDSNGEHSGAASGGRLWRYALIGAVVAGVAGSFAYVAGWLTPGRLTQDAMIDAFEQANGEHPGFRRNHAKGLCVSGWFESNGQAQALSKAALFAPGKVPLVGRFALAGGLPFQPDAPGTVRSLALRFLPPNGQEWRTGMNNIPVFPVNSAQAFYELTLAGVPDKATGKPDPATLQAFLAAHPEAAKALGLIKQRPISSGFADSTYNALDAFRFVNAAGGSVPVRWAVVPVQPFTSADLSVPVPADQNYLFDALIAQIHQHPLQWHLQITVGQPGDPTADATLPWPADRPQIDAGTITIDQEQDEDQGACTDVNYDPLVLPPGIEPSDDPLLSARSAAYAESFTRRAGEHKPPSAVQERGGQP
jgi:catalase